MEETRLSVTPILPHLGQLADLHVYLVPVECWALSQKLESSYVMQEAISYGFVRVQTHMILHDLRSELEDQLEKDVLPKEYVFLKSVGRNFARVKDKQEFQLRVRDFLPPIATEPELYLMEIILELDGNQNEKFLKRGKTQLELISPSHLPTLTSPINVSTPSGAVSGLRTTVQLPPVSPIRAKATGVNKKNRATSSTGLVAVDPQVKFPRIKTERPKSESHVKKVPELKTSIKKPVSSKIPIPPPFPPPPPRPPPSRIPVSRSRNGNGPMHGRRVSVTANVLKKRHYGNNGGRASAIISHQPIIVPNGRKMRLRGTALSDVAEESESSYLAPLRVEGPERTRQKTSFGRNYRAVQKVFDLPQESTDEEILQLEALALTLDTQEDKADGKKFAIRKLEMKKPVEKAETKRVNESVRKSKIPRDITVTGRRHRRRTVTSSGALRPVSNLDIRSAHQDAILKYELTVSELKDLRHAACHTSERTNRPIMYRRSRPIPRTVWYPRPLLEGGNPSPVLRRTYYRRGRRSKAARGGSGHAYYTLNERRPERSHVSFNTRIGKTTKKKPKPKSSPKLAKQRVEESLPAFQIVETDQETPKTNRPPYSKSKRRKKKAKSPIEETSGSVEKPAEASALPTADDKPTGGCCDWVIDNISLEEFTNSEEKRKQVLQPIRKAAEERRKKQVEMDAKNGRCKSSASEVPQPAVLLCSVDRPH